MSSSFDLHIPGVRLTGVGLEIAEDVDPATIEEVGRRLGKMHTVANWWTGDWLNVTERRYGATYQAAVKITGRSSQTLANIAWVARSFENSRRHESLPFWHHAAVLGT
jgi:homospermidine synthase